MPIITHKINLEIGSHHERGISVMTDRLSSMSIQDTIRAVNSPEPEKYQPEFHYETVVVFPETTPEDDEFGANRETIQYRSKEDAIEGHKKICQALFGVDGLKS